jgi:hypothetical protein
MPPPLLPLDRTILDRMVRAVELVRERLLRATTALDAAGVSYAVIGGNAVAAWVARHDPAAVRNTPNVDILLRRSDLVAATTALTKAGFYHREDAETNLFTDEPQGRPREAVRVVFAGEMIRPNHLTPAPDVAESERGADFQVITLEALVRMKLTAFRNIDCTHLYDMLEIGLIDALWVSRFPAELGGRLQQLIDTPGG